MDHSVNCNCVICEEWGGREPDWQLADDSEQYQEVMELPDPFDEVFGG